MPAPTVALDKFLPMVLPHVPGVPEPVATFQLRLAAVEFAEQTRCWRHITEVDLTADGQAIAAPDHAAIHEIEWAIFDGETYLTPVQFSDIDEPHAADGAGAAPIYISQARYNTVRVIPFAAGTLKMSLFLKPVNGTDMSENLDGMVRDAFDVVPEFLFSSHAEPIASGAVLRLLTMPGKPWTDAGAAKLHALRYQRAMEQHFSANVVGQQRARRRTRYRDF